MSEAFSQSDAILVTGGGGFIGGWLVRSLTSQGFKVRAVDIKPISEWHQVHSRAENITHDLRALDACRRAVAGTNIIYNFACDMGGMGFIETHKAECMLSVLINTHLLQAAREFRVRRYFFASSACVYNVEKQRDQNVVALKEEDAYPAMPEDGYGWEKLFSEQMCRHFTEDFGVETRVARYHNIYGPHGPWTGGREKAPAAICRKVIEAKISGRNEIEIWGDGRQMRSFTYIDDCIDGTLRLMRSDLRLPVNIGSSELVSINHLVDIVESIAGIRLARRYLPDAPKGVRGRNSDNSLIRGKLGWEPSIALRKGLEVIYSWIYDRITSGRDEVRHG